MKLLFVALNAKYPHTNPAVRLLTEACKSEGLTCGFIEHTINTPIDTVACDIQSKRPDVAAFSCYIWNIRHALKIAESLKKQNDQIRILLGGPEVSYDASDTLEQYPYVDYVIRGEGERAAADFGRFLLGKKALRECASLTWRKNGVLAENPIAVGDAFETAGFPYPDIKSLGGRVIYYEASRGCPFACAFCLSAEANGFREKPIEAVMRDIKTLIDAKVSVVKFVDRTFNADRARALSLIEFIKGHSQTTCFHLELSPALLDEALIDALLEAKPGIFQLEIGIQSTHAPALAAVNRRDDFAAFSFSIRRLTASETLHVHLDLIAGLPEESLSDFKKSFDDVFSLRADNLQLGFLKLLKGTPLRENADTLGITYDPKAPYEVIETPWLSKSDLNLLKKVEYLLKRIANSGLFPNTARLLARHFGSAFEAFVRLSDDLEKADQDPHRLSERGLTEWLWRFCEKAGAVDALEMLLFEAMQKPRRPRLPGHILTQKRRDFRTRYLLRHPAVTELGRVLYPLLFSFDVLAFARNGAWDKTPTVALFDYRDPSKKAAVSYGSVPF